MPDGCGEQDGYARFQRAGFGRWGTLEACDILGRTDG